MSNRFRLIEPFSFHDPWDGVKRHDYAWGSQFDWYTSVGQILPNTQIFICVGPQRCPPEGHDEANESAVEASRTRRRHSSDRAVDMLDMQIPNCPICQSTPGNKK